MRNNELSLNQQLKEASMADKNSQKPQHSSKQPTGKPQQQQPSKAPASSPCSPKKGCK